MEFQKTYKHINPYLYFEIFKNPQWYLKLEHELSEFFYNYNGNKEEKSEQWFEKRKEFIEMVAELLKNNEIVLAKSGKNWDEERLPVDTIVIHHTSSPPDKTIDFINALGFIRLYSSVYGNGKSDQYGKPIWSNHFYQEKQIFIAYHYLIKPDGSFENILQNSQIGWHCGDWEYNRRSIAICFFDDLKEKGPTENALQTAREIIKKYPNCHILGHREIKDSTFCPGNLFLGDTGWKNKLLIV